jgi:undecaprenyl-diphosphatase
VIETLQHIDRSLLLFLNGWHAEWLNPLMKFFSGQIFWLPFTVYFIWIAFKGLDKKSFWLFILFLILVLISCDVTSSYIFKNLTLRLRPCRELELQSLLYNFGQRCGGKYGFVSSHAANSFALVSFAILTLKLNLWLRYSIWLVPVLVSYSRIYLGVHYPGDILGGTIVGLTWSWIFSRMLLSNGSWSKTPSHPV